MAFINSKANLSVRLSDGSYYRIPKDFIGEVPEHVFNSWLVQAAIKSGHVVAPEGKSDKQLEAADKKAKKR